MKVLVVGGGGREHALVWKLAESPLAKEIYCAPGNAGIAQLAQCVPIKADDVPALVAWAVEKKMDLVVVGPEIPLTLGLVDALNKEGIKAFGPTQKAALLEGSKAFSKELMKKYKIPTARFGIFSQAREAKEFVREIPGPWVVKADGLAAGKGVLICSTKEETLAAIDSVLVDKTFGQAGDKLILEEYLEGEELTLMAFCDGRSVLPLASAQDHKRAYSGDLGPNTGGMGAYSPAPLATDELVEEIQKTILSPVAEAMVNEGREFKGILYAGLMITPHGPVVLEFNARFGDPETQVVLPRLKTDLLAILLAVEEGNLGKMKIEWREESCVSVVMASQGYPGRYEKGFPIAGLKDVPRDILVFHSGTDLKSEEIITAGGRVLAVTALGKDIRQAVNAAYESVKKISFPGAHYRDDIAQRALK